MMEDFAQAVRNNPKNPRAHAVLASVYAAKNLYDQAISEFTEAIALIRRTRDCSMRARGHTTRRETRSIR